MKSIINQIKNRQSGFTIVELLVVIVVIGILASITIVAYNGVTNRANQSAALSTATTVRDKAEIALAISSSSAYPAATADFTAEASLAGSGFVFATSLSSTSSTKTVIYQKCTTPASGKPAQQIRVGYYDATLASGSNPVYIYAGGSAAADCTTWATALSGTF
jgi:prepilin-type N-terminal cleavage/methylation domain-containing protein